MGSRMEEEEERKMEDGRERVWPELVHKRIPPDTTTPATTTTPLLYAVLHTLEFLLMVSLRIPSSFLSDSPGKIPQPTTPVCRGAHRIGGERVLEDGCKDVQTCPGCS